MGFKSKEIIIGSLLILNELQKYQDKIKTQSALDPHRKKDIFVSGNMGRDDQRLTKILLIIMTTIWAQNRKLDQVITFEPG